MLKQLRTQTKTIMWLVAVSFVGLMLFQWGMDFTGRHSNGQPRDSVGSVNGEKISWSQYENALSNNRRMYMERNRGEFPQFAEKILEDQTWNSLVGEALLRQEAKRLGVQVTDADILMQIQTNPPREVMQLEAFQTNGKFDPQKYTQALSDPRFDWTWLENYVRAYLPQQKIQDRVISSVVVSDAEARAEFARRNDKVKVTYVTFRPDDFPASGFTPSEDALRAYYEAHPREYQRPPTVTLTLVSLPKTITESDWRAAQESALEAKKEFESGVGFEDLAPDYSDAPNAASGGDLGWITRGALGDPAAETALFAMTEPGSVSDPVRGEKGVYLFQLVEREGDRVHPQEILIAAEAGHETVTALVSRAESIRNQSKTGGLGAAASSAGVTPTTVGPFDQGMTPPELQNTLDVARFASEAKQGEVSPVFDEKNAVVVVEITQKSEAGTRPMSEVRTQLVEAVTFEARLERAVRAAEDLSRAAQGSRDLSAAARARGLTPKQTASFPRVNPPPDFAPMQAATAMCFALPVGEVSPPIKERIAAFVVQVNEHTMATNEEFAKARDGLIQDLLSQKRQEAFGAWYQELRDRAKVEDHRAELLASAQEQDQAAEEDEDTGQ